MHASSFILALTCVQVSVFLQPPVWHHTAAGTSGSPPFCGRWHRRGTEQWTYNPLDMHMAPSTRMRTVWRCCWTSCQRRTFTQTHGQTERDISFECMCSWCYFLIYSWQRDWLSYTSCWGSSMCHCFPCATSSYIFALFLYSQQGNSLSPEADEKTL